MRDQFASTDLHDTDCRACRERAEIVVERVVLLHHNNNVIQAVDVTVGPRSARVQRDGADERNEQCPGKRLLPCPRPAATTSAGCSRSLSEYVRLHLRTHARRESLVPARLGIPPKTEDRSLMQKSHDGPGYDFHISAQTYG
jgi:hypothetical protein